MECLLGSPHVHVCPFACTYQGEAHWANLRAIWYCGLHKNLSKHSKFSLKKGGGGNIVHFTCITRHDLLLPAALNYRNELFSNDMVSAR